MSDWREEARIEREERAERERKARNKKIKLGLLGGGLLVTIFLLISFAPFAIIGSGETGIVITYGKVSKIPLSSGFHIIKPWSSVQRMDIRVQKEGQGVVYNASSKDLQDVNVKMITNFQLLESEAPRVYDKVGLDYFFKIIQPATQEELKAEFALYNSTEIMQNRSKIRARIQENLTAKIKKYGFVISELSLADIGFSEEYERAIENKQLEEQKAAQKVYEEQQEEANARIKVIQAKGEAESQAAKILEEAKAKAEAINLKAEAESNYNKQIAASLTPQLIKFELEKLRLSKWEGKVPVTVMGGDAKNFLVDVRNK